jgi:alcohol/geraniol dehydrogenase (NADP+)
MTEIRAWAAMKPGGELQPFTYTSGPVGPEEVLVQVEHCGICHTDLSFWKNEPGSIPFPFVPGHEITGKIVALGMWRRRRVCRSVKPSV